MYALKSCYTVFLTLFHLFPRNFKNKKAEFLKLGGRQEELLKEQ